MAYYETVVVVDPLGVEGVAEQHAEKVKTLIESRGGKILKVEDWGKRKLAYSINHRREGLYSLVEYEGDGEIVAALDQYFRVQESVLRYLTIAREAPSPEGSVSPVATDQGHSDVQEPGSHDPYDRRRTESPEEFDDHEGNRPDTESESMDA